MKIKVEIKDVLSEIIKLNPNNNGFGLVSNGNTKKIEYVELSNQFFEHTFKRPNHRK